MVSLNGMALSKGPFACEGDVACDQWSTNERKALIKQVKVLKDNVGIFQMKCSIMEEKIAKLGKGETWSGTIECEDLKRIRIRRRSKFSLSC